MKMNKAERKIIDFLMEKIDIIMIVFIAFIAFYVRYYGFPYLSSDMAAFLIPWYEEIKNQGGLSGLANQVGNYNVAYQTIIAVLTYFPVEIKVAYKFVSITFDYLSAVITLIYVRKEKNKLWIAILAYFILLLCPSSIFNSSFWGQCDSIYSFWCLLTVILLTRKKYNSALYMYGIALSFKLQAVFLLPFLMFFYVYERRFSIFSFIFVGAGFITPAIPAIICGKSIRAIISVYIEQTGNNNMLYINWPSFWSIFTSYEITVDNGYNELKYLALAFTVAALLIIYYLTVKKNIILSSMNIIKLAMITVYTCVFFLPDMHERYNYLTVVLASVICVFDKRSIPIYVVLSVIELFIYGALYGNNRNLCILGLFNVIAYVGYIYIYFKQDESKGYC